MNTTRMNTLKFRSLLQFPLRFLWIGGFAPSSSSR